MQTKPYCAPHAPLYIVLTNRKFGRLWLSQIASQLASHMLIYLLAIVLYGRTGSNAVVSGIFLSYGLPALFFGPIGGVIVDRLDRRMVLLCAHAVRALLLVFVVLSSQSVVTVYVLVFAYAIIMQMTTPSEVPLIPKFVPQSQLIPANSLFSFTFYSSMAVGFITAGPVLRLFGSSGAYGLIFSLFLIAAFAVWGLPPQGDGLRSFRRVIRYDIQYIVTRLIRDLYDGIRYVIRSYKLRDAVLLLTGTQITLVLLGTLGPGFADKVLRIDVRDASLMIVGPSIVGILIGALWIGNNGFRYSSEKLIRIGVLAAGISLIVISTLFTAANAPWFSLIPRMAVLFCATVLFFFLGIANSMLDVPSNSILQREAKGEVRGRVYGILSASVGGAGILPVAAGGVLADMIGVGTVIFILGLVITSYGVFRSMCFRCGR